MTDDEWFREEYRGREEELISGQEILQRTGYQRSILSKWRRRHSDMPKEVLKRWGPATLGKSRSYDFFWVRDEMEPFLKTRIEKAQVHGAVSDEDRYDYYQTVTSRLRKNEKRLDWITNKETKLREQLASLQKERRKLRDQSNDDRRFVEIYQREHANEH
ncbi:hypothetical protein [Streptomyces sp. PA5.6]|uniref:hypothetical protein n=1 Tax=Streptomyces sp. PA5.6 TaxID=3035651 RepID=UPI0039046B83